MAPANMLLTAATPLAVCCCHLESQSKQPAGLVPMNTSKRYHLRVRWPWKVLCKPELKRECTVRRIGMHNGRYARQSAPAPQATGKSGMCIKISQILCQTPSAFQAVHSLTAYLRRALAVLRQALLCVCCHLLLDCLQMTVQCLLTTEVDMSLTTNRTSKLLVSQNFCRNAHRQTLRVHKLCHQTGEHLK